MILVGNQRGGAKDLALHLMKDENERVEIHELRGFMSDDLMGLKLVLDGYDTATGKITDIDGGMVLVSANDDVAALWGFTGMMQHWNRKNAQAAYVPSLFRTPPPEYSYGPKVLLCEQTDFSLFLKAVASGVVYYDPAVKMEQADSDKPKIKRRSQFRIKHQHLPDMYHRSEVVGLGNVQ